MKRCKACGTELHASGPRYCSLECLQRIAAPRRARAAARSRARRVALSQTINESVSRP